MWTQPDPSSSSSLDETPMTVRGQILHLNVHHFLPVPFSTLASLATQSLQEIFQLNLCKRATRRTEETWTLPFMSLLMDLDEHDYRSSPPQHHPLASQSILLTSKWSDHIPTDPKPNLHPQSHCHKAALIFL